MGSQTEEADAAAGRVRTGAWTRENGSAFCISNHAQSWDSILKPHRLSRFARGCKYRRIRSRSRVIDGCQKLELGGVRAACYPSNIPEHMVCTILEAHGSNGSNRLACKPKPKHPKVSTHSSAVSMKSTPCSRA